MKYKLLEFELNKQSLKRKLPEINEKSLRDKIEKILDERTTKYEIEKIEFIIDVLYSDKYDRKISNKPLGIFYSKFNKEKYNNLKCLINIKKTGSITKSLKNDIKNLINKSNYELISENVYNKQLENISEKYCVTLSEIYKIHNKIENEWINSIS